MRSFFTHHASRFSFFCRGGGGASYGFHDIGLESGAQQALGEGDQLGLTSVWPPRHTTIWKDANDRPSCRAAQRFDAITGLKLGGFTKTLDDFDHRLAIEHAGNVVRHRKREVAEQSEREFPPDCGKRVAVEEKKRGLAMKLTETIQRLSESQDLRPDCFPLLRARTSSFRVNSMLCSTSFARSSIDADDRLPVPVFDKSGSGLKR